MKYSISFLGTYLFYSSKVLQIILRIHNVKLVDKK